MLMVTGYLKNIFGDGRVRDRKLTSSFLEITTNRRRRKSLPEEYWPAVLPHPPESLSRSRRLGLRSRFTTLTFALASSALYMDAPFPSGDP